MRSSTTRALLLLSLILAGGSCAGMRPTRFLNPEFDFSFVERVAVIPFENLSGEQRAGARATRLFITELLATEALDVIEPGEVQAALNRLAGADSTLGKEQIIALGKSLGVQGIILGNVNESRAARSGTAVIPVVTLDVHMVEVDTGTTVWAATHTEKGSGLGPKFLGTSGEPLSATTRRCVKKVIRTLVR